MFQLDSATFILLTHTHYSWLKDFAGLQDENLKTEIQTSNFIINRAVLTLMVIIKVIVSSYWAAICGDGGFTGLQKQLHPEIHGVLFRGSHFRWL